MFHKLRILRYYFSLMVSFSKQQMRTEEKINKQNEYESVCFAAVCANMQDEKCLLYTPFCNGQNVCACFIQCNDNNDRVVLNDLYVRFLGVSVAVLNAYSPIILYNII